MTSQLTAARATIATTATAAASGGGGGGGGVGVQVFTRPTCVVDHLGMRATVTLLHSDERDDAHAQQPRLYQNKLLPAQATAQVCV